MRNEIYVPSASDWNEFRDLERQLFDRNNHLTPQLYPQYDAAETWSSGLSEPIGANTVAYNAIHRLFTRNRHIRLTNFHFSDMGGEGMARLYELNLREGKECITTFSVFTALSKTGVSSLPERIDRQRFAAVRMSKKVPGVTMPNRTDFEFVREQLQRGVTDAFTRWAPRLEQPDDQR